MNVESIGILMMKKLTRIRFTNGIYMTIVYQDTPQFDLLSSPNPLPQTQDEYESQDEEIDLQPFDEPSPNPILVELYEELCEKHMVKIDEDFAFDSMRNIKEFEWLPTKELFSSFFEIIRS
ncbi:hypothetical protein Tco_0710794 [Tanacetum coccineum]